MGSKLKAQILTAISPGKPFSFSSLVGIFKSLLFRSYYASDFESTIAARCKSGTITIDEALGYFHSLVRAKPRPSIRTFNHLLGAVSKMNHDSTVVSMFRAMLLLGRRGGDEFRPEVGTLNIVIRSLCRSKRVDLGFSVFALGIKTGVPHNARTTNTLLHGLCAAGSISDAAEFFRRISVHSESTCNEVTYATMINGFCRSGDTSTALEMIESIFGEEHERERIRPSVSCFSPVINRLCKERRIDEALRVFRDMIARGVPPKLVCFNSLIDGLGKSGGRSEEAAALVSEMASHGISPDVRSYNSLIDLLCKEGKTEEAVKLTNLMAREGVKPDVVTFNSLLSALCKRGRWDEVSQVLRSMKLFGVDPDIITFNTVLNARCKEGSTEVALHLVETITNKNSGGLHDPETYNSLLCGLCHLGRLEDAHRVFDAMVGGKIFPDIWTLNIVLDALCNEGMMEKSQWLFDTMMEHHKEVNNVTYNTLIKGYSRQGQMDKARDVFIRMALKGVFPDIISYNTLVKGYVKIKKTNLALKLLKDMVTSGLLPNHISRTIFRTIVAYRLGPYFQHFHIR